MAKHPESKRPAEKHPARPPKGPHPISGRTHWKLVFPALLNLKHPLLEQPIIALPIKLAKKYPVPLIGTLWLTMLLLTFASVDSLLSPELKEQSTQANRLRNKTALNQIATSSPNSAAPPLSSSQVIQQKSRVPLWLFGAIALTCASSSIVLTTQLPHSNRRKSRTRNPQPHSRNKPMRAQPARSVRTQPNPQPEQTATVPIPQREQKSAPTQPISSKIIQPNQHRSQTNHPQTRRSKAPIASMRLPNWSRTPKILPAQNPTQSIAKPTITPQIIAPQINHPLDWPEGSVIDAVDLRKQRSLSSWLAE